MGSVSIGQLLRMKDRVLIGTMLVLLFRWSQLSAIEALTCMTMNANPSVDRRVAISKSASAGLASIAALGVLDPNVAYAADSGLAAKLSKRDASVLKNSAFNIPPQAQVYPDFMRGKWAVEGSFRGFLFPSQSIQKDQVISKADIPGFQKCSIAQTADVGKEKVSYEMLIDSVSGLEDRKYNFASVVDANLNYKAVDEVIYDGVKNPNRISISFVKNQTRNAERIELFCNARESELVQPSDNTSKSIFVCSEYIRQVTFSLSTEFGVARQAVGNYAHFWTWREQNDADILSGNLLTAAYLDPNDPLFFQEPAKPIAVYSQNLTARRIT